jgi:hypothetical protein
LPKIVFTQQVKLNILNSTPDKLMKWAFREQMDVWEPEESLRLGINNETKNNGRRDKRQHTEIQGR